MIGKTNALAGMKQRQEMVNISLSSNQASHDDLVGAVITLSYGEYSEDIVWDGSEVTRAVPAFVEYAVSFGAVKDHKTPAAVSYTAVEGNSRTVVGTYLTELVSVTLSADDGTKNSLKGQAVTINGKQHTFDGTHAVEQKVAYGVTYTVSASAKDGYATPEAQTFTADTVSRSVSMVYEEIKKETLTVAVTGVSSGFTVSVINASTGAVIGSQTSQNGSYEIEDGTRYYVTASAVSGYETPGNSATRTAVGGSSFSVVMSYVKPHAGTTSPTNGVWIQDTDGYYHTESAWDGSYTPNGIAVITDNCRFVIALDDAHRSTCRWGGYGETVSGITTTTSSSEAQGDYDGEAQTTTIINALKGTNDGYVDGAPAAEYCRAYTFPDGSTGYMGAAGEWKAALYNKAAITSALGKCGGTAMSGYYWTSTQYSSSFSWYMSWTNEFLGSDLKYASNYVRAFAAI